MADADTDAKPVDQDALVADIDRTRTELARTIDAIAERVNPKKNVDRALGQVRKNVDRASEQIRKNVDRASGQARQRVSQIDPLIAGVAAAAVVVSVTGVFLWRRRKR